MSTTTEKWTIFGERLKTELERQEMSLRQFAEKAGLTLTTACRYVHSQRTPRATEILKAAKVLGVTCDYMLGLSDDPHKTRDGWAKAGFHELPSAQPETHDKRTETHSCDLIDRQAAIDAHYEYCNKHPDAGFPVWSLKILEDLPSAQPEPCEDTISRQDAIDYCYALINAENPSDPSDEWNYSQERINQTEVILHHLEVMPSTQPKHDISKANFLCPICGAEMEVAVSEWEGEG